jgi:predicted ArsR family transcriptional regulator
MLTRGRGNCNELTCLPVAYTIHYVDTIGSEMTTRQQILEILDVNGRLTIGQIAEALRQRAGKAVSSVTIRYHLNVLLAEGRVAEPQAVPRTSRGRPQHVFESVTIADRSRGNSAEVLSYVLASLQNQPELATAVIEQVAQKMACAAGDLPPGVPAERRLAGVTEFLNTRGYDASVERVDGGFILYTRHCPYHDVPERQSLMCSLDMRVIEAVVGQPIQRLLRLADGDNACAYFINIEENP